MKTLEQIREEQRQLEEKRELDEYVREAGKFIGKLAIALGITTVELTKSIGKTVKRNPKSSILASPFIASAAIGLATTFGAFKSAFAALMTPLIDLWTGKGVAASATLADGMGIGVITMGALMVVLYGQKVGTKINKALMKRSPDRIEKKADKKQVKALVKLATA